MKIVFDEWYGELSYAQRAAYRKHNVTPVEHTELVMHFGENAHAEITNYVKRNAAANNGTFLVFDMYLGRV